MDCNFKKLGRHTMEIVGGSWNARLQESMKVYPKDYIRIQPGNVFLPYDYVNWYDKYDHFEVKTDDVWVVTFPKAGTTWMQEIVWSILFDMKSQEAKEPILKRFPYFEFDCMIGSDLDGTDVKEDDPMLAGNSWKFIQSQRSPRTLKSHFPAPLLPSAIWSVKPKIIYVSRDPRDVCVSYYYHTVKLEGYSGPFNEFVDLFINDMVYYGPIWQHILHFWEMREQGNILFIRYEDMQENLPGIIRTVGTFLGKVLTEEKVREVSEHCTFDIMKKNSAANNENLISVDTDEAKNIKFMRKGIVGDWRNHFTDEHEIAFEKWALRNTQGTDFPYYQDYK